jgi:hypothetical protein
MGDPRVASPILRRPARFGLAASDRGYAGCELRRNLLPRTSVNGTNGVCVGSVHLLTFIDLCRLPP